MKNNLIAMEEYLKNSSHKFIFYDDILKNEDINKLKKMYLKYNKTEFCDCFENTYILGLKWKCELECERCGNVVFTEVGKVFLLDFIKNTKNRKNFYCEKCVKHLKKEKRNNELKNKQKYEQKKVNSKFDFIRLYLNPDSDISYKYIRDNYSCIKVEITDYLYYFDDNELKKYIDEELTYKEFLNTPYWKFVSYYKKKCSDFKCQICGTNRNLNTHHNSYEHKGSEMRHLNDLIVLCEDCHDKFHIGGNNNG